MSGADASTRISVDTEQVRGLAEVVRRARAEARAVLDAPHLLRGSLAAMAVPGVGGAAGALATASEQFLNAWQQALDDAADELDLLARGLDLAAQLYETTQRVESDRHGITLLGAIR